MAKLTKRQIWDMAGKVARQIADLPAGAEDGMGCEDLMRYDFRCAFLVEDFSGRDAEGVGQAQTLTYFRTLVKFLRAAREAGYRMTPDRSDKEEFVRTVVGDILLGDPLGDNEITEAAIGGGCVRVTFTGPVSMKGIAAIGSAFGDDSPDVYGEAENAVTVVVANEKYKELND